MTHTGVDHLGAAGSRAIAPAVVVGAEERTALDHLARHTELRLVPVEARRDVGAPRVGGHTARRVGVVGMPGGVPVGGPLPDVAGHVEQPEVVGRERTDGSGAGEPVGLRVAPREITLPEVRQVAPVGHGVVAPHEGAAVHSPTGRVLPLGLGRQLLARPRRVRLGVLERDMHHGVIATFADRGTRPLRTAPRRTGRPCPPLAEVAQVDRACRRREHERAGHEVLRRSAGEVSRIERTLGHGGVARRRDERRELLVGHRRRADLETVDAHGVDGGFLGIVLVGTHAELPRRDPDHALEIPACSFSMIFATLNDADSCRGGNSTRDCSIWAT